MNSQMKKIAKDDANSGEAQSGLGGWRKPIPSPRLFHDAERKWNAQWNICPHYDPEAPVRPLPGTKKEFPNVTSKVNSFRGFRIGGPLRRTAPVTTKGDDLENQDSDQQTEEDRSADDEDSSTDDEDNQDSGQQTDEDSSTDDEDSTETIEMMVKLKFRRHRRQK